MRSELSGPTILFDLWGTLGTKGLGVAESLASRLGIPSCERYERRYEQAIQTRKWDSLEELAVGFLHAFNILAEPRPVAIVTATILEGIEGARPTPGIAPLLNRLRPATHMALLSNTTNFEATVVDRWALAKFFDQQIWSWETGALKPDATAFHIASARLGVSLESIVLIDDTMENVEAARTLGARAVHFTDSETLTQYLIQAGILRD